MGFWASNRVPPSCNHRCVGESASQIFTLVTLTRASLWIHLIKLCTKARWRLHAYTFKNRHMLQHLPTHNSLLQSSLWHLHYSSILISIIIRHSCHILESFAASGRSRRRRRRVTGIKASWRMRGDEGWNWRMPRPKSGRFVNIKRAHEQIGLLDLRIGVKI